MLLTGDARGDKVMAGLKQAGVLQTDESLEVDIIKFPHHASDNNVDPDFFRRVRAQHYVASGDGKHGNPERRTFEMLFGVVGNAEIDIHLTYSVEEIDMERKKEANKDHEKGRRRRPWDAARDGLRSFFDEQEAAGTRFRLHEPGQRDRITINLRDPITF